MVKKIIIKTTDNDNATNSEGTLIPVLTETKIEITVYENHQPNDKNVKNKIIKELIEYLSSLLD